MRTKGTGNCRIDINGLTPEFMENLDKQIAKYGLKSRNEYIRLIIELDVMTGIVGTLKDAKKSGVVSEK